MRGDEKERGREEGERRCIILYWMRIHVCYTQCMGLQYEIIIPSFCQTFTDTYSVPEPVVGVQVVM